MALFIITGLSIGVAAQDEGTIIINTNLVNGATYNEVFDITVSASHPDGILFITVNIDGSNVQSEYSSSLTHEWDTTMYSDGAHHIQIRSAVNSTFGRAVDYELYVNNTIEATTTQQRLDVQLKIGAMGASAAIISGVLGLVLKADLLEKRRDKVVTVIGGAILVAVVCAAIWIFL